MTFEFTPKHELSGRHRFRRLRVRHDGIEAQGVLHSEHHQLLGIAGRQQVRPRGGRVCQSLLEEPGDQPFSGVGRGAGMAAKAARGESPGREDRHSAVASRLDQARNEAGQSGVGKSGRRRPATRT